jgi:hypothetical protein
LRTSVKKTSFTEKTIISLCTSHLSVWKSHVANRFALLKQNKITCMAITHIWIMPFELILDDDTKS